MLHSTSSTTSSQVSLSQTASDGCMVGSSLAQHESSSQLKRCGTTTENLIPPSNLPIELIDRILDFCDYSTFLRLAQVNRFFNLYATGVLLSRELISWSYKKEILFPSDSPHMTHILEALNIRQCDMHANLQHLEYTFDARTHLCHQLVDITRFLQNKVMSVDSLTLCFISTTDWDGWNANELLAYTSKLVTLLEAALLKGCRQFDLSGYLHPFKYHPDTAIFVPTVLNNSRKQHRVRCIRWLQSYLSPSKPPPLSLPSVIRFPMPTIPTPSPVWQSHLSFQTDSPSLETLEIVSSLMLIPPLLSHTFSLLQNQSPVLRELIIIHRGPVCEEFFSTVTLPKLRDFSLFTDSESPRLYDLVFLFLTRHPGIQNLSLPLIRTKSGAEYPTFDVNTFLPKLSTLYVHLKDISWIFRDSNTFLNLEHLSIAAQPRYTFEQYEDIDAALVVLSSRMSDSCSSRSNKSPAHLRLSISVDDDFDLWLLSHTTKPWASPIRHLKSVERLSISLSDEAEYKTRHLDNLITWAGLLPNLRWLTLDGWFDDELYGVLGTEGFITNLKDGCPRLERCRINRWNWVSEDSWPFRWYHPLPGGPLLQRRNLFRYQTSQLSCFSTG